MSMSDAPTRPPAVDLDQRPDDAIRRGLEAVATVAAEVQDQHRPVSERTAVSSDQLVHRAAASMADIHAHALAILDNLEDRITDLRKAITLKRDMTQASIKEFVELIGQTVEASQAIDAAICRVQDQVIGQSPQFIPNS